eukprot:362855-Chlamydomonas_euryale.AAC.1
MAPWRFKTFGSKRLKPANSVFGSAVACMQILEHEASLQAMGQQLNNVSAQLSARSQQAANDRQLLDRLQAASNACGCGEGMRSVGVGRGVDDGGVEGTGSVKRMWVWGDCVCGAWVWGGGVRMAVWKGRAASKALPGSMPTHRHHAHTSPRWTPASCKLLWKALTVSHVSCLKRLCGLDHSYCMNRCRCSPCPHENIVHFATTKNLEKSSLHGKPTPCSATSHPHHTHHPTPTPHPPKLTITPHSHGPQCNLQEADEALWATQQRLEAADANASLVRAHAAEEAAAAGVREAGLHAALAEAGAKLAEAEEQLERLPVYEQWARMLCWLASGWQHSARMLDRLASGWQQRTQMGFAD